MSQSDDPRINRIDVDGNISKTENKEHWQTFEVFHQKKRGAQHTHVGIVHAPSAELAMVFAKEQYGRRQRCVNLWVVKSSEVYSIGYENEDMFTSAVSPEKKYREASGFSVRDRVNAYKKEHNIDVESVQDGYFGGIKYD